jgi:hypothetical protein
VIKLPGLSIHKVRGGPGRQIIFVCRDSAFRIEGAAHFAAQRHPAERKDGLTLLLSANALVGAPKSMGAIYMARRLFEMMEI